MNRRKFIAGAALGTGVLDAFTIGAENDTEQADLIQRIAAA